MANDNLKGDFLAGVCLLDCDLSQAGKLSTLYLQCSGAIHVLMSGELLLLTPYWLKCIMLILGNTMDISYKSNHVVL